MWPVCLLLVGGVGCNLQAQFLVLWHHDVDTVLERALAVTAGRVTGLPLLSEGIA